MNLANLKSNYEARERLEKAALMAICECYYYDLADTINSMTDAELEEIIASSGNHMPECADL
jgi:redox-regulated HSP33 family molecular chaperone